MDGEPGPDLVRLARENQHDLIVLGLNGEGPTGERLKLPPWADYVVQHAHCRVFLALEPNVPKDVVE